MVMAASPPVAERLDRPSFHFVMRQSVLLPFVVLIIGGVSLLQPHTIRRIACIGFVVCIGLLVLTLMLGPETKGARRWLSLGGFSLQPSELVKPCFAVLTAWMLAEWRRKPDFPGAWISLLLVAMVSALLLKQPDLGQTMVVLTVWFGQLFIAGLPIILTIALIGAAGAVMYGAYLTLDHVSSRIDRFFDPNAGDTYQVDRSMEAFAHGGLFGTGPGEGRIKSVLPDAHSDFVFSVMGEEFGALAGLLLIGLIGFLVLRGFMRLRGGSDLFIMLAGAGLLAQFGVQSLIHMGSALQLIPAKGMTLPFISYGGTSLLAMSFGMGMVLAFTRSRHGREPAT